MSDVITTTDETFQDDIDPQRMTVIDFWATWCGPCRSFAPVFASSATANPDIAHVKIDVDANPRLAGMFHIQSIPTTVYLREGFVLGAVPGAMGPDQFAAALDQMRNVDMQAVRAGSTADAARELDVNELAVLESEGCVIIDVREPDEFAAGAIPGARNVPLGELDGALDSLPREVTLALVCRSGNRSGRAQEILDAAGFTAVNLTGGMNAWRGPVV